MKRLKPVSAVLYTVAALTVAAVAYLYWRGSIMCPVMYFFSFPCPGCGMTRALKSALCLDFAAAFAYHPLWVAVLPAAAFIAFFALKRKRKALYATILTCIALLVIVWFRFLF